MASRTPPSLFLIATLDGQLEARDRLTGVKLWSLSAPNTISNPQTSSLPNTPLFYLEPHGAGSLYMVDPSGPLLQRFPLSIRDLVHRTPFRLQSEEGSDQGSRVLLGYFTTHVWALDPADGALLRLYQYPEQQTTAPVLNQQQSESELTAPLPRGTLWLSYTLYTLTLQENEQQQTMTYGDWRIMDEVDQDTDSMDATAVKLSLRTSLLGKLQVETQKGPLWSHDFEAPVIALFANGLTQRHRWHKVTSHSGHSRWTMTDRAVSELFVSVYQGQWIVLSARKYFAEESTTDISLRHPWQSWKGHWDQSWEEEVSSFPFVPRELPERPALPLLPAATPAQKESPSILLVALLTLIILCFTLLFQLKYSQKRRSSAVKPKSKTTRSAPVRAIQWNPQAILGHGANGTLVFQGTFDGRPCAVKRLYLDSLQLALSEVDTLISLPRHDHVLYYFYKEIQEPYLCIALELCLGTLNDLFQNKLLLSSWQPLRACLDVTLGLHHLHSHSIIHRDLKPANILIQNHSSPTERGRVKCVVGDFGLAKRATVFGPWIVEGQVMREASTVHVAVGTRGWRAPEVLAVESWLLKREQFEKVNEANEMNDAEENSVDNSIDENVTSETIESNNVNVGEISENRVNETSNETTTKSDVESSIHSKSSLPQLTQSVDLFSLGCLFFYILTRGQHPFGDDPFLCDSRILQGDYQLAALLPPEDPHDAVSNTSLSEHGSLTLSDCDAYLAHDLIEKLLSKQPEERPSTQQILTNPLFWSNEKRLLFLCTVSDFIDAHPQHPLGASLELSSVIFNDWFQRIHRGLVTNLLSYRHYNADQVRDLLRAIRNKVHHWHDLTVGLQRVLGGEPNQIQGYFEKRFPRLLLHVYRKVEQLASQENVMKPYFSLRN